jgi:pyruvate formate lyase activating enzyme
MTEPERTSVRTLLRAAEIGASEGLRFVYAGILPGAVGRFENTYCPGCQGLLVERRGYRIGENRVTSAGACPDCGRVVPGVWSHPETRG